MKYIGDYYGYTSLTIMKKKSLVKIRRNIFQRWIYLRNNTISKAKAIYELKDLAIEKLKQEDQYDLYRI